MSTAHPRYHPDCSPTQGTPLGAHKGDDPLVQASVACAPVTEGVPARPTGKSRNTRSASWEAGITQSRSAGSSGRMFGSGSQPDHTTLGLPECVRRSYSVPSWLFGWQCRGRLARMSTNE